MQKKLQNNLYLHIDRIVNQHPENQVMVIHNNLEKQHPLDKKIYILGHQHQHQELEVLHHLTDKLHLEILVITS